ncbi:MAG TPA: sigma-54-dependent Fis family transcriptional regulator [Bryobacteraceae bacterium]|nr:sigma-54-dependent Fis family transcriptional regulator [Bryobacteraceae bacterium]
MGSLPQTELHDRLAAILAICRKMNSERELGPLLDLIAREATHLLDCDRASIFLLDRERQELWSKVALGSEERLRFDARLGIVGQAVTTGRPVNVQDAYHDPRFYTAIDDQTGYRTRNVLAVAMRNHAGETVGAFEVLNKRLGPFTERDEQTLEALAAHAASAIETAQLIGDLRRSQDELAEQNATLQREVESRYSTHGIVGTGARIQQVVRLIERIRDSVVNVLITGESGTGKEMAAKAIHYTSPRARKPFVALNCAALPEALAESELFGIEKGVATGVNPRPGQFQKADGGTLFLDEIGDLSLTAQAKILRVLQERVVERVGGRAPVPVDVRLLAATNKDLESEIAKGAFREDLYYRIKVIHIHMPPLREIREDIPLLARHFLKQYCDETGRPPFQFAPAVLRRLSAAPWPGNVRQLRNEVIRMAACARGSVISEEDLLEGLPGVPAPAAPAAPKAARPQSLKQAIEALEREMVTEALAATGSNQQQAARRLGLSRQGLINKMKRYGL